jgi:hypothetical protein
MHPEILSKYLNWHLLKTPTPPALSFILLAIGSFIPMKPNDKVLVQISKIDPKELGNLKPEQLQQLKENMEKLQESLKKGG